MAQPTDPVPGPEPAQHAAGSGAVGLVLARPARLLGVEPFFMEFIAGIEETISAHGLSILLHIVDTHTAEIAAYRRWAERSLVDAVIVVNLVQDDERPRSLRELALPCLMVGNLPETDLPAVRADEVRAEQIALAHLLELGHRRIARVTGPSRLLHTRARTVALVEACRSAGVEPVLLEGDYSAEAGTARTAQLLGRADPPTAIVYDNDVMAVAGLRAAHELGFSVPEDLSLVAWDDSALCRLSSPAMTTMSVDVHEYGVRVARSVLEIVGGGTVTDRWAPTARLTLRASTAAPRGRGAVPHPAMGTVDA